MNISILDKATDKIIDQMTPEELATYTNGFAKRQAQKLESGNISVENADREAELFAKTHVQTLPPNSYIQYMDSLHRVVEKDFVILLSNSNLHNFDLRASLVEMQINARSIAHKWYCALCRREHSTKVAGEMVEKARQETCDALAPLFQQLEDIKKEQEEYLAHPMWVKWGIIPEVKERECLLLPMVWDEYVP